MTTLQPYTPNLLPTTRTGRTLSRISDQTTVAVATVQAKAEIEAAKVNGIAAVSAQALQDIALLSQMEQSLAQAVPHASGRLAMVADMAAVAMANVVGNAARRLGG